MRTRTIWGTLLFASGLIGANACQAELGFWSSGDLLIIHGKAEKNDVAKLKEKLTPEIKTVVARAPTGMDYDVAFELAKIVEAANVTTVAHGTCTELVCPMIFLSGKNRQFSGAASPKSHTVTLGIGESHHVIKDTQTKLSTVHEWWRNHSKLSSDDTSLYRESWFSTTGNSSKFDRKVFFPAQAKFSKGNVLHCSGNAKSQNLVDCMPVKEASALSKGIVTSDEPFVDSRLVEAADLAPPNATNIAALNATPVANMSDRCKEMYQEFLKQDSPRAFVVSTKQGCNWASIGIRPYDRAMKNCKPDSEKECRFYAVDDKVVFTPFGTALPEAKTASNSETTLKN